MGGTSRAHEKRKSLARTPTPMTMRSPQRKRGAGAAWRLACALLISVHAAAAHERPAAAIANALVVANEQRASIDVPSATKSDAGSSSAGLQSVALLYRGATNNLAPVVGSALLLASAVPARSSAWRAPVFGYLLFPGGFVRAAAVRGAARFKNKGPRADVSVAAPGAAIAEREAVREVPKFMKSARPAQTWRRLDDCVNDDSTSDSWDDTCSDYYDD